MKKKSSVDLALLTLVFILSGMGLVTVYSSSAIYALDKYGSSTYFLWRQLAWTAIGLAVAFFLMSYDHKKLKEWIKPLLFLSGFLLIAVLFVGRRVGGAKRWLRIGPIGFQPSEFAKLVLILFVASYCDRKQSKMQNFQKGLLPLLVVLGMICGLIFIQPDFGTPALIIVTCLTMIFIGGGQAQSSRSLRGRFCSPGNLGRLDQTL